MAQFPASTGASGIWPAKKQKRAKQGANWPSTATVPGAPTGVSAVGGNAQATVSFTAPASDGGAAITGYRVTSSPGSITATGSSSPITITGLTNGTAYTFTVAALNSAGYSAESSASGSVTPAAGRVLTVSPAVAGKTSWNLDSDGPLNLGTAGSWTITPASNFDAAIKVWGGGATNAQYNAGAGGAATGTLSFVSGSSYVARVGSTNGGGSTNSSATNGAGYSGIFISSETQANAKIMAGGGGGSDSDDGGRNANGGAGGGATGQDGQGYSNSYGKGGTQSAAGAGGSASSNGSAGSGMNGGAGNTNSGSGYYGGGGGSGYYGGGGGGMQASWAGGGGGGGSGYIGGVTGGTNYQGNYTTPGNSTDANRGTAGSTGQPGRVYIS